LYVTVYLLLGTGKPLPSDIQQMVSWMMELNNFEETFALMSKLKVEKGLALQDLISDVYDYVHSIELPSTCRIFLVDQLAIEYRIASGCEDKLQLLALIGAFQLSKDILVK
jgi:replication factor C subunit 3/5